ncbi:uncharacterized protein [Euwallacea fornicatus]|uniref:uncharacterized protein isoform X1 n=1 Tax=Euwallacea fornicatus TaxID=995702 RepID=UPI0033904BAD
MHSHTDDLDDYMDMETMKFVNPYEVNPIIDVTASSEISTIPSQVSLSPDYIITQKDGVLQNQLKMEEFSDLSALLLGEIPNVDLTGCTDELNTPVFDKEAFDFTPPSTKLDENKTGLKVKVEYNSQYYSRGKNLLSDLDLALDNQLQSNNVNEMGNEQCDMYLYQPFAQSITTKENSIDFGHDFLGEMLSFKEASLANNLSINNNNIKDSNSTSASPQDDRYSCISSPAEDQQVDVSVPDHFDQICKKPPALNLMLDQYKFPIKEEGLSTLNTPDVIDEVVLMGTDFNILKLVNNEDIATINADNDFLQTLTSPSAFSSEPSTPSTTGSQDTPAKRPRKRRMSDDDYDDDEDYVPPSYKKRSTVSLADIDIENSNSSDDSYYQPSKSKKLKVSKRRGRPPKRGQSVSSEGSKDQEVSRYRELRDKNNEASRKSRLKRKEKEKECEKEADELNSRNIRLKAQVEELEKMVTTFRTNLFKILVTK